MGDKQNLNKEEAELCMALRKEEFRIWWSPRNGKPNRHYERQLSGPT